MIFTVPMRGSEVVNSKTEIHTTKSIISQNATNEVVRAFNITTIEHEGDFVLLGICYCVW